MPTNTSYNLYHYPYCKVQNIPPTSSDVAKRKYLYRFKSPKSKQWYWIWVELYDYNMYAIKFHLKSDRNSKLKYNRLTNLYEARPVINTCIAIMLEIAKLNPCSSFGFIGSNLPQEGEFETKRFRIYRKIMLTYFTDIVFYHSEIKEKSTYIMIRRTEMNKKPDIIKNIEEFFSDNYPYFD